MRKYSLLVRVAVASAVIMAAMGCGGGDTGTEPEGTGAADTQSATDVNVATGGAGDAGAGDTSDAQVTPDVAPEPKPGDACGEPFLVSPGALPWVQASDLGTATDDFSHGAGACEGEASAGGTGIADQVYVFTPTETALYDLTVDTDGILGAARIYVTTDCNTVAAGTCLGSAKQNAAAPAHLQLELTADTTYWVVVDGDGGVMNPAYAYTLTISEPCYPSCEGKECGGDGCGGNCGVCPAGSLCTDEQACFAIPTVCAPVGQVACGQSVPGTLSNDGLMSSDAFDNYSCPDAAGKDFSKSWELTWTLTDAVDQKVTVLADTQLKMRMTVLAGPSCEDTGANCVAHGVGDAMQFTIDGGQDYFLVWDALDGAPITDLGFELTCCAPQCDGKVCGTDGCGGFCGDGTCAEEACVEGQCQSVPDVCAPIGVVTCNADGEAANEYGPFSNTMSGVTKAFSSYSCQTGTKDYSAAAEATWTLTVPDDAIVTVQASGSDAHLAVLRDLDGACEDTEASCVEAGKTGSLFSAKAGDSYHLVWDVPKEEFVDNLNFFVSCCYPTCDGTTCGDDGCGGTCECDAGTICEEASCVVPAVGESCQLPIILDSFPVNLTATTADYHDVSALTGNDKCDGGLFGGGGTGAADAVFAIVPEVSGTHIITVQASGFDAMIYLSTDCADLNASCIDTDNAFFVGAEELNVTLEAGTAYFLVVDGSTAGEQGGFALSIVAPCISSCTGKLCGDDGCGGSCGSCQPGEQCITEGICDAAPTVCEPAQLVACNETVAPFSVAGDGATFAFDSYPCHAGDFGASTEMTFEYVAEETGTVKVTLTDPTAADVIVLLDEGNGCEVTATSCLQGGDGSVVFQAQAGESYLLVVDQSGAQGGITGLNVACAAGGNSCADALVIDAVPATLTGDTSLGYGDKFAGTPCDSQLTGTGKPDVIYAFTPEVTGTYTLSLDYVLFKSPGLLYVLSDCANEASCLASKNFFPGGGAGGALEVELTADTTYTVVVDSANTAEVGPYTLSITGP